MNLKRCTRLLALVGLFTSLSVSARSHEPKNPPTESTPQLDDSTAVDSPASPTATPIPTPTPTPTPPPTGAIEITVERRDGGAVTPASGVVVWVEGAKSGAQSSKAVSKVTAKDKRFLPRVASVPVGGTVDFPNQDRIYHNVFSLSETKTFDLGLYRDGKSKSVQFDKPGVVKVYCNIHPKMVAYVVVVGSAYHTQTGDDGHARLERLPVGKGTLRIWDERVGEQTLPFMVTANETQQLKHVLEVAGVTEEKHKNKFGEEYPTPDDEESRY